MTSNLATLQRFQATYDASYWQHNATRQEKVRHVILHLGKTLGKLCTFAEAEDHGRAFSDRVVKDEVTPDLLFHALQLANLFECDLASLYKERTTENMRRHTKA